MEFEKILFPTDFSKYSEVVIPYVVSLAKKYKSKLYMMHVIEVFLPDPDYLGIYSDISKIYDDFEKETKRNIHELKSRDEFSGIDLETIIVIGKPFLEIIKTAKEKEIGLIVMGTHGRSGLNHVIFGSTAEKVVRKAPCPVLTVKHPEYRFVMP